MTSRSTIGDRLAPSASGLMLGDKAGRQVGPSRKAKVIALLALTVQNAVYALIIKYSRTAPRANGGHYLASSVVVVTEIAKAICSLVLLQASSPCRSLTIDDVRAFPSSILLFYPVLDKISVRSGRPGRRYPS